MNAILFFAKAPYIRSHSGHSEIATMIIVSTNTAQSAASVFIALAIKIPPSPRKARVTSGAMLRYKKVYSEEMHKSARYAGAVSCGSAHGTSCFLRNLVNHLPQFFIFLLKFFKILFFYGFSAHIRFLPARIAGNFKNCGLREEISGGTATGY